MTHQPTPGTIRSLTTPDGVTLNYRHWEPSGPCRGVVLVVHGIQSHSGWYLAGCTAMARGGFAVGALDRRGSGLNRTARGHLPGWRVLLEDMDCAADAYRSRWPGVPLHVVGISWGGKQAAAWALERPGQVRSLVLSGPGFFPQVDFSLGYKLRIALGALFRPKAPHPIPIGDGRMFTDDPKWIGFVDTDPLTLRQATARFFVESRRLDRTERFFNEFVGPESRIKVYGQSPHTLEFGPEAGTYIEDLVDWLVKNSLPVEENAT
ncbi:MAG: alpha/beta fold hydrolase [Planctomycetota bacterium]